jgi:single-stranded-DNA-specific exonuclease
MAEIKNLKKTAERILKAIRKKEKIILFSDADMDGTCSVIILEESIKNLGGNIEKIYFPNRETEGYGINEQALNYLKNLAPALLISMDCGIGNFKEVKIAKKIGFEVIIIDHHEILKKLPSVSIVVDPKQKGDKYPFKNFSTTGIVYKLSEVLLKEKLQGILKKNLMELAALATISDMMPQTEDNQILIEEGLSYLTETLRPGLKIFWKIDEVKGLKQIKMIVQKIISVMNAAETQDHLTESYLLLNALDEKAAEDLVQSLIAKSAEKHLKIKDITFEIEKIILKNYTFPIVFEGKEGWPLVLMGPVASRLCRDYQKPVFVYRKGEKISRGAVRTPAGINSVDAMKSCEKILETFGGHPLASGFTIKNKNLEKFKNCLVDYFLKIKK